VVENTIENCEAAVFPFPAASTAMLAGKSTVTVPFVDGITSIVYVVPLPDKLAAHPLVMVKSDIATPVTDSGNVNVTGIG
jgi:hypothetical protein